MSIFKSRATHPEEKTVVLCVVGVDFTSPGVLNRNSIEERERAERRER